ncbi:venom serine carboxypeptidase [Folsomia candida]|uniref:venom serine carboxypeptidase n=1 Tax=Folsomia candida TaxID=158441 RepID=UPI000B90A3D5|nr:venom serine carboxypeptidase [Folsomia candida]
MSRGSELLSDVSQARVSSNLSVIKSYSGFFTVNKEYNSNLFFWFFPAAFEPDKAPVILWLNGGPGTSSLFGLFVENGPFKINLQGFLEQRQYAWTMTHSLLYIDNPVGTGFSFTDDARGYSKNQVDIGTNLFQGIQQFFRAFPEYAERDFYIAGESYAGKYVPSVCLKIHLENRKKGRNHIKINLKGMMIGSGFFDPLTQNEYGEYLYHMGLIDDNQKVTFLEKEAQIRDLIEGEEWADATRAVERLIVGDPETSTSLFQNMTGYSEYLNMLHSSTPREFRTYVPYLNKPSIRQYIHVGNQPYTRSFSPEVLENMVEDISKSVKPWVERLLKENYRVLIYASQLDLVVPHTGVQKFISNLDWPGSNQFSRTPRRPWKVNGEIAGYTKFARNLAYVLVRNAGHVAPYDQPLWMYEMINRFTRGSPF